MNQQGPSGSASIRRAVLDGLPLALVTLVTMVVAVVLRTGHAVVPATGLAIFVVVSWLPLLVRTVWPLPVLVVTAVLEAAQLVVLPLIGEADPTPIPMAAYQPVPVATTIAAFAVARAMPRRTAWIAGGVAALGLPLVAIGTRPGDFVTYFGTNLMTANLVLWGTATGVFMAARVERVERAAAERTERTRRAVEDERLRIARELHDVLAHHITLVDAQVAVAAYLVRTDPEAAAASLSGLAQHTRSALDELRATVGLLRGNDDDDPNRAPTPGLDRLPTLLVAVRDTGVQVRLTVAGQPRGLPPRSDLAGYRIVQEALTNAAKHAPGAPVVVALDWTGTDLHVSIENRRSPTAAPGYRGAGTGNGQLGMRERALTAGGSVAHLPTADGGYRVDVHLPTQTAGPREPGSAGAPDRSAAAVRPTTVPTTAPRELP